MEYMLLKDMSGKEVKVQCSGVLKLEGRGELETHNHGPVVFAGRRHEFVLLETKEGDFKIPRNPENDSEILSFLLTRPRG